MENAHANGNGYTGKSGKGPLVSFVIPVFNGEGYLAKAINSCLNQIEKRIEVIIIDDGSTDNTDKVAYHFRDKDNRVTFFRLDKNRGRSFARNTGNQMAKADIICVQDADDESLEKRATITLDYFKNHPEVGAFYGGFLACDYFGNTLNQVEGKAVALDRLMQEAKHNIELTANKDTANPLNGTDIKLIETGIGHCTMAYRNNLTGTYRYDETGEYSRLGLDDWKLQVDMLKGGVKFGFTMNPLAKYRQLRDTISGTRDIFEVLKVKQGILYEPAKV